MSLSSSFFDARDRAASKYKEKGYLDVSELEPWLGITEKQLFEAGLIKLNETLSTADLHSYDFTTEGEKYFVKKPYQLMLLRPGRIRNLLELFKGRVEG